MLALTPFPQPGILMGRLLRLSSTTVETSEHSFLDILLKFARIIQKRKWLIVSIAVAFLAIGAVEHQ